MIYAIVLIAAYFLGSIPFGFLLTKMAGKGDLRAVGSGGTGATNTARVLGIRGFIAVWILDMVKSIAAVLLGNAVGGEVFGALCGLISIIGHCYPVWLKFHGGKGISSMFGTLLAVNPLAFVIVGIEWLLVAVATRYSSFGAVVAMLIMPILGFAMGTNIGWVFICITIVCLWRHRANIARLLNGTESKLEWRWKK